jgi:hypothetical protein
MHDSRASLISGGICCFSSGYLRNLFIKPTHALWLKKYFGSGSVVSKISDDEDSTAILGDSEMLCVQHPVAKPIPEFRHRTDEAVKISSVVACKDTWYILPEQPTRSPPFQYSAISEGQISSCII